MKKFVAKHDLGKLAPIAVEILLWNEMEQKIGAESQQLLPICLSFRPVIPYPIKPWFVLVSVVEMIVLIC